ncbi:MAG: prohibitin family protein [Acutalibacteraceae bacterium]
MSIKDKFVNTTAQEGKVKEVKIKNTRLKIIVTLAVIAVILLILIFSSITQVPAGSKGVLLNMGAVSGKVYNEGIAFKIPFIQEIEIIDTRVKKLEIEDNSSASKDLQPITSSIAVNYRVNADYVCDLYQNIGVQYESTIISPAISECIKSITSQYTAEELITKRSEVSEGMKTLLQEKLKNKYIIIDSFNITNFSFSDAFNAAIEEKQIAEQNALKAKYDLERIQTEAQQEITKAQGEAEAMKIKNEQLSDKILYLEYINKWDGKMPTYYGGSDNFLFGMNLTDNSQPSTNESSRAAN